MSIRDIRDRLLLAVKEFTWEYFCISLIIASFVTIATAVMDLFENGFYHFVIFVPVAFIVYLGIFNLIFLLHTILNNFIRPNPLK